MARLALVLPVYNARESLHDTFHALTAYINNSQHEIMLVFVDDASSDGSLALLHTYEKDLPGRVVVMHNEENRGKGYSIQKGLSACSQADIVGFTDIDLPYTLDPLVSALDMILSHGKDVVIGDRTLTQGKQYSWYRKICTDAFRLLLPRQIREYPDTQSGIKLFTYEAARHAFSKLLTHRWVFDIEILLTLQEGGYAIGRIPVKLRSVDNTWGGVSFLHHGPGIVKDLIKVHRAIARKHYTS